jgi:hypothetical protein
MFTRSINIRMLSADYPINIHQKLDDRTTDENIAGYMYKKIDSSIKSSTYKRQRVVAHCDRASSQLPRLIHIPSQESAQDEPAVGRLVRTGQ